jgi:DNA-damage-inducible protein J
MSERSITISAPIDPELKRETEEIFERLGVTLPEAIHLFLTEVKLHNGFPFELKIPNEETRQALAEAENKETMGHFHTVNDLFKDLEIS